jgi:hypothetical protein
MTVYLNHLLPAGPGHRGAQFQKAADTMTENPMQTDFSDAADQLFEAGLQRMEGIRDPYPYGP